MAILLATLAPSFAATWHAPQTGLWTEICSVTGSRMAMPAAPENIDPHQKNMLHLKHCPYCFHQHNAYAPPPDAVAPLPPLAQVGFRLPILFYQASRPLAIWSNAHPRAPPQFC